MAGTVKIKIIGDWSNFKKSMDSMTTKSVNASKQLAVGVGLAGAAVTAFGVSSVKAYQAAEEAQTKLSTNLLNVKGNTMANVEALNRLASSLQNVGVIEDDVIKAGMSQLATFNLQGKTIEKLTPKITDMVAQLKGHNATAEDMVGINNLVGKVMTGNIGSLSRYGVTLSENQKKLLKNGDETQRANILTEVLAQNYGEVNKALRNTPEGRITALKNRFGDLQEGVGKLLLNAIEPMVKIFDNWLTKVDEAGGFLDYFKTKIKENEKPVAILASIIAVALIPALWGLAASGVAALAPFLPFIAIGTALGLILTSVAEKLGGWDVLWGKISERLSTVWESIQLFIDGDFSKGLFGFGPDHAVVKFLEAVYDGFIVLKDAFMMYIWPNLKETGRIIKEELLPELKKLWVELGPLLLPALKAIGIFIAGLLIGILIALSVAIMAVVWAVEKLTSFFNWFVKGLKRDFKTIGEFRDKFKGVENAVKLIVAPLSAVTNSFSQLKGIWDGLVDIGKKFVDVLKGISKFGDAINPLSNIPGFPGGKKGRALGGKVNAGQAYTVGEGGGPEMFVPETDGVILNARETRGLGGGITIVVNARESTIDEKQLFTIFRRYEGLYA